MTATLPIPVIRFSQLIYRVEDAIAALRRAAQRLVAECRRWLPWLGPAGAAVRHGCAELARLVERAARELGAMLADPGHPVALWQAGDRWRADVGAPAQARVAQLDAAALRSDDRWQGAAAEAYLRVLPPQQAALAQVAHIGSDTGDSLHQVALSICAFWAGVAAASAVASVELGAAAAAALTPMTLPAAVGAAVGAVTKLVKLCDTLVTALDSMLRDAAERHRELLARVHLGVTFPGGRWPRAAAGQLADGSMTDNDGSDWALRY